MRNADDDGAVDTSASRRGNDPEGCPLPPRARPTTYRTTNRIGSAMFESTVKSSENHARRSVRLLRLVPVRGLLQVQPRWQRARALHPASDARFPASAGRLCRVSRAPPPTQRLAPSQQGARCRCPPRSPSGVPTLTPALLSSRVRSPCLPVPPGGRWWPSSHSSSPSRPLAPRTRILPHSNRSTSLRLVTPATSAPL